MTGPLAPYVRPTRAAERPGGAATATAASHRAVTRSTRAVTQSVAAVADIMRSAKRPAVFAQGLMPSRLRRWWWKTCDRAWDVAGTIAVATSLVMFAFVAYMLIVTAYDALFR